MNAAERVRAYLQARYRVQALRVPPQDNTSLVDEQEDVELREADLEVLLQMQTLLATLLSAAVQKTNTSAMPAQDFIDWAHSRATQPKGTPE